MLWKARVYYGYKSRHHPIFYRHWFSVVVPSTTEVTSPVKDGTREVPMKYTKEQRIDMYIKNPQQQSGRSGRREHYENTDSPWTDQ